MPIGLEPTFLMDNEGGVADWVTPAGNIVSAYEGTGVSFRLEALGRRGLPVTYAVVSGTLPPGLTLNTSTGVISGVVTYTAGASNAVYDFVVSAVG